MSRPRLLSDLVVLPRTSRSFGPVRARAAVLLLLAACSSQGTPGSDGAPGAKGAPGETPPPPAAEPLGASINQVFPRVGLVDREMEVTLTADATALDAESKVSFGDGIKVVSVEARGPALVVRIAVAPNAKLGGRDVTVTPPKASAGAALVAKNGFVVAVPLVTKVGAGKAEQGGLVRLDVSNRDKVWFDTERFTLLPLVSQSTPSLVALASQGFTATDGSVVLLGDPLAKTGPLGFLGVNDPSDPNSASYLTDDGAVTVGARAPELLESGKSYAKTLGELETGFFGADFAPSVSEGLLVEAWAKAPEGSTMKPMILAYPESGTVMDLLDQKQDDPGVPFFGIPPTEARVAYPVTRTGKGFFVVLDASLGSGATTKFELAYSAVRAQILKEKADAHATTDKAQNLGSLPGTSVAQTGRIVTGELKEDGEVDVYAFTGLSTKIATDMLVTITSDAQLDVVVDTEPTMESEGAVKVSLGGKAGSSTTSGHVGATRFIKVMAAEGASKSKGTYTLGFKRLPQAK